MKKSLPLSLIAISLLLLSACSNQDNSSLTDNGGQSEAPTSQTESTTEQAEAITETETPITQSETSTNPETEASPTQSETSEKFTLASIYGVPSDTNFEMNSWPKEITLVSDEENITRKIEIEEREECMKKHPFNFETYSGDFTTKSGQKLNRLSYPEEGADSLFVVDEYGLTLDNGHCLTFSYNAVITGGVSSTGGYDEAVYSKELEMAAEIMSTLTVPSK